MSFSATDFVASLSFLLEHCIVIMTYIAMLCILVYNLITQSINLDLTLLKALKSNNKFIATRVFNHFDQNVQQL